MTPELRRVKRAAEKTAQWRYELEEAVLEAHRKGESLRAIAQVAGWSHEQVRTIVTAG